jgi:hypothetical protein
LVSYLNAGIGKLTEEIYTVLEDVRSTRTKLRADQVLVPYPAEQVRQLAYLLGHSTAYVTGLVKAWEIVTGEIWGEAAWQPTGRRN